MQIQISIKKILILILFLTILDVNALLAAGKGLVRGNVSDSETGKGLPSASVYLLNAKDSSTVSGNKTDKDGGFKISGISPGEYIVKVNYIGYKTIFKDGVSISKEGNIVNIDKILMSSTGTQTDEILITSERDPIEYSLGKKVINVDKNLTGAGGSAIDILKNVPSVNVDVDGTITMRGSSNLTILIDGKPSSLSGGGISSILEQLPAGMIENIEIINNPSAKYNPEGNSGIINIVLKKDRQNGLNGLVNLNVGTRDKYSAGLNLNYRIGKFNLFGSYDIKDEKSTYNAESNKTILGDTALILEQDKDGRRNYFSNNVRMGFDYNFSKSDILTASAVLRNMDSKSTAYNDGNTFTESEMLAKTLKQRETSKTNNKNPNFNTDLSLSYKKSFETKGESLSIDAYYSKSKADNSGDVSQDLYINSIGTNSKQRTVSDDIYENYSGQIDYTLPFEFGGKIETGAKVSSVTNDIDYSLENLNAETNLWINDPNATNRFIYNEDVIALYGTYSQTWDKFSWQAGLRVEQTNTKANQQTSNAVNKKDYLSFFPSTFLSYKFNKTEEMQISYSRRITRPEEDELNPFTNYSDPYNLRYGNPLLNPEYSNAYEIGYITSYTGFTLSPTVFYRRTDDVIARSSEIIDPANGIVGMTYDNIQSSSNYGVELNISSDFFEWWRANTDFSFYKSVIEGRNKAITADNEDYSWSVRFNSNLAVTQDLNIQIVANYRGPRISAMGKRDASYFADIALKQNLWNNDASITLRVSDIFKTRKFSGERIANDFISKNTYHRESQIIYLGFSYKINNGIKQDKKNRNDGGGGYDDFE